MNHSIEEYELAIRLMARKLLKKSECPMLLITSDDGSFAIHISERRVAMGKVYTPTVHRNNKVTIDDRREFIDPKPIILDGGRL